MIMFTRSVWQRRLRDNLQYVKECDQNSQTRLKLYKDVSLIVPYRPFRSERWHTIHGAISLVNCIDPGAPKNDEEYYLKYR